MSDTAAPAEPEDPAAMRRRASIIVNNYNYGRFVADAIESALRQTHRGIEIIVVDDGSTDGSREVIEAFGDRITAVFKPNGGQASAFNAGFEASEGDAVIFLDGDDLLEPDAVERCLDVFTPGTSKVHWPLWRIDGQGRRTGGTTPEGPLLEGDLRRLIVEHGPAIYGTPPNSPPTSGNAWARPFLDRVMPMPEQAFNYCADAYLLDLAPLYGTIGALREPLGSYRVHGANYTLKPLKQHAEESVSRYEVLCDILRRHLSLQGEHVDPGVWSGDTWHHRILGLIADVDSVMPAGARMVLIDGDQLSSGGLFADRPRFHFLDRDGQPWGHPANDPTAIQELERLRDLGAGFLVVAWTAFWYFDHYRQFTAYVAHNFPRVLHTDRAEVFDLR